MIAIFIYPTFCNISYSSSVVWDFKLIEKVISIQLCRLNFKYYLIFYNLEIYLFKLSPDTKKNEN